MLSRSSSGSSLRAGCYLALVLALVSGIQETLFSTRSGTMFQEQYLVWNFCDFSHCVSSAISDLERFRDSRIRHYTVNQGVTSIFEVDRPR